MSRNSSSSRQNSQPEQTLADRRPKGGYVLLQATAVAAIALYAASAWGQAGLPQNLPDNLPDDLLVSPWDADYMWVERWGSNGSWGAGNLWRTGQQVGSHSQVNYNNNVLITNRSVYRDHLQQIPNGPGVPNGAGISLWVGTAEPGASSGNDNIDVGQTFTVGSLSVQNVSAGAGRSFRSGGTIIFDSGDPSKTSRIVHLGDENSNGDDMNIREGTNFQLNSDTEMYLLSTGGSGPRFRIRDNSRITGTGDLILNPGNAADYATGGDIRRELRIEDSGRIATTGHIYINNARIRVGRDEEFGHQADIINTSGITINPQGQLRLDNEAGNTGGGPFAAGEYIYDFNADGGAVISLNSHGHLMDDGSRGAIRMQPVGAANIGTVRNDINVIGDSSLYANGLSTLKLTGGISGPGMLQKSGFGRLLLTGETALANDILVSEGTLELADTSSITFYIGQSGVNNRLASIGPDVGTLILDGEFVFDLSQTGHTLGDSWTIVDSEFASVTYGGNFRIADFTETHPGVWVSNNPYYEFSQATGILTLVPEPSTVALLVLGGLLWSPRRRR